MKKIIIITTVIIICFLVGFGGSLFQTESIQTWYPYLNKSPLTPPNTVFPIVWSILYFLMGLSIGLIIANNSPKKSYYIKLFAVQLILNFTWSIVFFYLQKPSLGLINIVLLDIAVLYYAIKTYRTSKISSILFIPYIIWIYFATYLNLYILLYN